MYEIQKNRQKKYFFQNKSWIILNSTKLFAKNRPIIYKMQKKYIISEIWTFSTKQFEKKNI